MFCVKCGKELPDGAKFCINCGTKVDYSKSLGDIDSIHETNKSEFQQKDVSEKFIPKVWLIGIAVIVIATITIFVYITNQSNRSTDKDDDINEKVSVSNPKNEDDYIHYDDSDIQGFTDNNLEKKTTIEASLPAGEEQNEQADSTASNHGDLSDEAFQKIHGHYIDDSGDTVDIFSEDRMLRFIVGGNESHTYDEKICGYNKTEDGYLILTEWGQYKNNYLFVDDGSTEYLYLGNDEGWNPDLSSYDYNLVQIYKKEKDDFAGQQYDVNDPTYPWGIGDIKNTGLSQEVYDKVKGSYYVNGEDITIKIISPTEIEYVHDEDEYSLIIERCESRYNDLNIYVSGNLENIANYQNIFMIMYSQDVNDYKVYIGSGTFDYSKCSFDMAGAKIDDSATSAASEWVGEYYSCLCMLYKEDDGYYIYPIYEGDSLISTTDPNKTYFYGIHGTKISKNATVSIATSLEFTFENDIDVPHFKYKEYKFYDVVEEMLANGHWKMVDEGIGSKAWYFTVDGMDMPNCLIVTIDENNRISSLKDYYGD